MMVYCYTFSGVMIPHPYLSGRVYATCYHDLAATIGAVRCKFSPIEVEQDVWWPLGLLPFVVQEGPHTEFTPVYWNSHLVAAILRFEREKP
jgi:hypothetical protein